MPLGISSPSEEMFYSALLGFLLLGILVSFEVGRKLHWSLGVALSVLLLSGGYQFFLPQFYPVPVNPVFIARAGGETLYSISLLLLFSILLISQSKRFFSNCLTIMFFLALIDSIVLITGLVLFKHGDPNFQPHGILFSGTADACFIACMLPMTFERFMWRLPFAALMFAAILCAHSNTAFASVGVGLIFFSIDTMELKKWLPVTILLAVVFALGGYFVLGSHFLENSGRFPVWASMFEMFRHFANPIFGFGTGTFSSWGQVFQMVYGYGLHTFWLWLHNEPLEILWENGILGLTTVLLVFWFLMKRTYHQSVAFPIAAVYAFTGLTEMPLRLFITQFLGVCLLSEAFKASYLKPILNQGE